VRLKGVDDSLARPSSFCQLRYSKNSSAALHHRRQAPDCEEKSTVDVDVDVDVDKIRC
jgi:hypothetical protein